MKHNLRLCKVLATACIIMLSIGLICGTVSARYQAGGVENAGINIGDTIFYEENGLDFSAFGEISYLKSTSTTGNIIPLSDKKLLSELTDIYPSGTYQAYTVSDTPISGAFCTLTTINLGTVAVTPFGKISDGSFPDEISRAVPIIFTLKNSNLKSANLTGNWGKLILIDGNEAEHTSITNLDGTAVSLVSVPDVTDNKDRTYAFRIANQNYLSSSNTLTVKFEIMLRTMSEKKTKQSPVMTIVKNSDSFGISDTGIPQGSIGTITLTAISFETYTVTITGDGSDIPYFTDSGSSSITVTPEWSGKVAMSVTVPKDTAVGAYTASTTVEGQKISGNIVVTTGELTLIFDKLPQDAVNGKMAEGDVINIHGKVNGASEDVPVYFYITGRNIATNGVNFDNKPVVDGDESSFTVLYYSVVLDFFDDNWNTAGFEPGTYTIHASLKPYGYLQSNEPGKIAYNCTTSHDAVLSDQSLHLIMPDSVTRGDKLTFEFSGRGSPGANGATNGILRWYIMGTNYNYTDMKSFALYDPATLYGMIAPPGISDYTYDRDYTFPLDAGTYTLLLQHPGPDTKFDVFPDEKSGPVTTIKTSWGSEINLGQMQTKTALYLLEELISGSQSDDLFITADFIIADPELTVSVQNEENTDIIPGDKITVSGTTNYADSDEFSLKIDRVNFDKPENNIAMMIPTERIFIDGDGAYIFGDGDDSPEIDTSTWIPGLYEATVTNVDTGYSASVLFNVKSQSTEITAATFSQPYDNEALTEYEPESTPFPTYEPYIPPTTVRKTTSPGFTVVLPVLLACLLIILRRKE